jgi:hypothetical protein
VNGLLTLLVVVLGGEPDLGFGKVYPLLRTGRPMATIDPDGIPNMTVQTPDKTIGNSLQTLEE